MQKTNITLERFNEFTGLPLKVIRKDRSLLHRAIGKFLSITGISKDYLTHFYTIIRYTIAVPGGQEEHELLSKEGMSASSLSTLFHEARHATQVTTLYIVWALRYLFSARFRALMELDAYMTTMSIQAYMGGPKSAGFYPDFIIKILKNNYNCKDRHLIGIKEELDAYYQFLLQGTYREQDQHIIDFYKKEVRSR